MINYRREKGFTLIELLVVISIVGILSSVALASLDSARERGRISAGMLFEGHTYHTIGDQAIGLWKFDESSSTHDAFDVSGNSHTLSPTFGITAFPRNTLTPMKSGNSLHITDSTHTGETQSFSISSQNGVTVGAWINNSFPIMGAVDVVSTRDEGNSIYPLKLRVTSGGQFSCEATTLDTANAPVVHAPVTGFNLLVGKWHYALCTIDTSEKKISLFVDGKIIEEVAFPIVYVIPDPRITRVHVGVYGSGAISMLIDNAVAYARGAVLE